MRGPAPKPSTVRVIVRSTTSRVPFRAGTLVVNRGFIERRLALGAS